jgi:hypothetical protein
MNTKQQLVTGFLAILIVGSIAFMPVNATQKHAQAPKPSASGSIVTSLNSAELPQDQVKDLTYN